MAKKTELPTDRYERFATLVKVTDGDTIQVMMDLGCSTFIKIKLRFNRVNTAEMKTGGGQVWKDFVTNWFIGLDTFVVKTTKDRTDKYGRLLTEVYDGTRSLVDDLLKAGVPLYKDKSTPTSKDANAPPISNAEVGTTRRTR